MGNVVFKPELRSIKLLESEDILDIQPITKEKYTYLALTNSGKIIELNTKHETINILFSITDGKVEFDKDVSILISSNRNIIAVFNTFGRFGLVIDLQVKNILMKFSRDDYYYDLTIFPINFFMHDNRVLLMHGTKWNRLDVTDPLTGEFLTSRVDPKLSQEHYLEFFHGQLLVSPDGEWVVDNGWVWHPLGSVTSWNIKQWLTKNKWESEDGESKKELWWGKEDWNDPICWISNIKIGIIGRFDIDLFDEEEIVNLPKGLVFRIIDVRDGSMIQEFNICLGKIFFDTYLYCSTKDSGLKVYDILNGKMIFEEKTIKPRIYHSRSKEFVEVKKNQITICKLIKEECNFI